MTGHPPLTYNFQPETLGAEEMPERPLTVVAFVEVTTLAALAVQLVSIFLEDRHLVGESPISKHYRPFTTEFIPALCILFFPLLLVTWSFFLVLEEVERYYKPFNKVRYAKVITITVPTMFHRPMGKTCHFVTSAVIWTYSEIT